MKRKVKKFSALLMAAVMAFSLNIVMPQEAKAATADSASFTLSTSTPTTLANATVGSNGVKVYAYKTSEGSGVSASGNAESFNGGTSQKGIKMEGATNIVVVIPANKYAQIKVAAKNKTAGTANGVGVSLSQVSSSTQFDTQVTTKDSLSELTFQKTYGGTEITTVYVGSGPLGQASVYGLTVDLYDNESDVPQVVEKATYTVTGTIQSDVELTGGKVSIGNASGNIQSEDITAENGTYKYVVNKVEAGTYSVTGVTSPALTEAEKVVASISSVSITVADADVTADAVTIQYKDLNGVWNFQSGEFEGSDIVNGSKQSAVYKGLAISTSDSGGKFSVRASNKDVQVNDGTTVSIPVSGSGTVRVTMKEGGNYTLGDVESTEAVTECAFSSGTSSVNLVINADSQYLYKIEVIAADKDTTESTPVNVQYKKNADDTYTVRTVYEIAEADLDNYTQVGVKLTVGEKSENSLGTTVYQSLKANGSTVKASEGKYYVITQITNVPADASIQVQGIAVANDTVTELSGVSGTVAMADIIK